LLRRSWDLPPSNNGRSPLPYQRSRIPSGITGRPRTRFALAKRKPAARQPDTRPSSVARACQEPLETPASIRQRDRWVSVRGSAGPLLCARALTEQGSTMRRPAQSARARRLD
jgi:hypothetical protein